MNILITGGCGFVGSNLAAKAMKYGFKTTVFDNLSRYGSQLNLDWLRQKGPVDFCYGDIRNANDVERLLSEKKFDGIFHVAGQVAMTTSVQNPRYDFEINALGSFNLLDAIRKYQHETPILYASTNKVYGDLEQYTYDETESRYICREHPNGFDEKVPLDMHSPYGVSKGTADQYVLDYARIFGLRTVVFRHSSMYGGRQYATFDQGWIGWFCSKALEQKTNRHTEPFTISGNGKQVRDILHIDDVTELYFTALKNIDSISGQFFNIGGGYDNSMSLLELFAFLENRVHVRLSYTQLPTRISDQKVFIADTGKITKATGWTPQISAATGIELAIQWSENSKY